MTGLYRKVLIKSATGSVALQVGVMFCLWALIGVVAFYETRYLTFWIWGLWLPLVANLAVEAALLVLSSYFKILSAVVFWSWVIIGILLHYHLLHTPFIHA